MNNQTWPSGTSWTNAATIAAYPGEVVTFPSIGMGGPAAYIIVDGVVIDGTSCSNCNELVWVGNGAHHIRFRNVEVRNNPNGQNLVLFNPESSFVEFLGGSVHDAHGSTATTSNGFYCFYITGKDALIDGVDIYNCVGYGIHTYVSTSDWPGQSDDRNTIRNSRIHGVLGVNDGTGNNGGIGILLAVGTGNAAYNNLVYNNTGPGIFSGFGATDVAIENNTIVGNGGQGIAVSTVSNVLIRNNILTGNSLGHFINWGSASITITNNLCDSAGAGCSVVGSPIFANAGAKDYRLQSGSPGVNSALTLTDIPATDMIGTPRPQGAAWDLGAYEFVGTTTNSPPAAPTNVRIVR